EYFVESGRLSEAGKELIPGGYSRSSLNFGPHAIFVERGEGAHIETVDGHRLLDLNNNFTVNALGHAHPAITGAIAAALQNGISFGNPVRDEAKLAKILVDRVPGVEKVQFSCSASESAMSAVRMARAFTGRQRIAKFEGGYHGFTDQLHVSVHAGEGDEYGDAREPQAVADSAGIPASTVADVLVLTQNDLPGTEALLRKHADEIACL